MKCCFNSTNLLLPKTEDMKYWSVIACDQHTSDVSYWERVRDFVGEKASTLNLILPEAYLANSSDKTINEINNHMNQYLNNGIFEEFPNSYVFVERQLQNGDIRQGIVGVVDLETYHYFYQDSVKVCATEETVMERIPPRVAVRQDAPMEFSHIIIFCDDETNGIVECVHKEKLPLIYDFDLVESGGHIRGWLVSGEEAKELQERIARYEEEHYYLVADGNHSLVTAKTCYEAEKAAGKDTTLSRYAMVELENINSPAIVFEPIHRMIQNTDTEKLLQDISALCTQNGKPITWVCGGKSGVLYLNVKDSEMEVGVLQTFLDNWLKSNAGEIDYLHEEDLVKNISKMDGNIGFLLPKPDRKQMFTAIAGGKPLPRKTFSLGHSSEKRYYLEGRKIK